MEEQKAEGKERAAKQNKSPPASQPKNNNKHRHTDGQFSPFLQVCIAFAA